MRFKLKVGDGEFRRFTLPEGSKIGDLRTKITAITGLSSFALEYLDCDGDRIVIDVEEELLDAVSSADASGVVRLHVVPKPAAATSPASPTLSSADPAAYVKIPAPPAVIAAPECVRPSNPLSLLGKAFQLMSPLHRPKTSATDLLPRLALAITDALLRPETCDFDVPECIAQLDTHHDAVLTQVACDADACDAVSASCREFVTDFDHHDPAALSKLIRATIRQLRDNIPEDALKTIVDRNPSIANHRLSVSVSDCEIDSNVLARDLRLGDTDILNVPILQSVVSSEICDSFYSTVSRDTQLMTQSATAPQQVAAPVTQVPTATQLYPSMPSTAVPFPVPSPAPSTHVLHPPFNPAVVPAPVSTTPRQPQPPPAQSILRPPSIFLPAPISRFGGDEPMSQSMMQAVSDHEILALKELADMGFADVTLNRELLHRYGNDVSRVVEALLLMG